MSDKTSSGSCADDRRGGYVASLPDYAGADLMAYMRTATVTIARSAFVMATAPAEDAGSKESGSGSGDGSQPAAKGQSPGGEHTHLNHSAEGASAHTGGGDNDRNQFSEHSIVQSPSHAASQGSLVSAAPQAPAAPSPPTSAETGQVVHAGGIAGDINGADKTSSSPSGVVSLDLQTSHAEGAKRASHDAGSHHDLTDGSGHGSDGTQAEPETGLSAVTTDTADGSSGLSEPGMGAHTGNLSTSSLVDGDSGAARGLASGPASRTETGVTSTASSDGARLTSQMSQHASGQTPVAGVEAGSATHSQHSAAITTFGLPQTPFVGTSSSLHQTSGGGSLATGDGFPGSAVGTGSTIYGLSVTSSVALPANPATYSPFMPGTISTGFGATSTPFTSTQQTPTFVHVSPPVGLPGAGDPLELRSATNTHSVSPADGPTLIGGGAIAPVAATNPALDPVAHVSVTPAPTTVTEHYPLTTVTPASAPSDSSAVAPATANVTEAIAIAPTTSLDGSTQSAEVGFASNSTSSVIAGAAPADSCSGGINPSTTEATGSTETVIDGPSTISSGGSIVANNPVSGSSIPSTSTIVVTPFPIAPSVDPTPIVAPDLVSGTATLANATGHEAGGVDGSAFPVGTPLASNSTDATLGSIEPVPAVSSPVSAGGLGVTVVALPDVAVPAPIIVAGNPASALPASVTGSGQHESGVTAGIALAGEAGPAVATSTSNDAVPASAGLLDGAGLAPQPAPSTPSHVVMTADLPSELGSAPSGFVPSAAGSASGLGIGTQGITDPAKTGTDQPATSSASAPNTSSVDAVNAPGGVTLSPQAIGHTASNAGSTAGEGVITVPTALGLAGEPSQHVPPVAMPAQTPAISAATIVPDPGQAERLRVATVEHDSGHGIAHTLAPSAEATPTPLSDRHTQHLTSELTGVHGGSGPGMLPATISTVSAVAATPTPRHGPVVSETGTLTPQNAGPTTAEATVPGNAAPVLHVTHTELGFHPAVDWASPRAVASTSTSTAAAVPLPPAVAHDAGVTGSRDGPNGYRPAAVMSEDATHHRIVAAAPRGHETNLVGSDAASRTYPPSGAGAADVSNHDHRTATAQTSHVQIGPQLVLQPVDAPIPGQVGAAQRAVTSLDPSAKAHPSQQQGGSATEDTEHRGLHPVQVGRLVQEFGRHGDMPTLHLAPPPSTGMLTPMPDLERAFGPTRPGLPRDEAFARILAHYGPESDHAHTSMLHSFAGPNGSVAEAAHPPVRFDEGQSPAHGHQAVDAFHNPFDAHSVSPLFWHHS